MTLATWLTFFVASWLISLSPGAGAISSMSCGLRYGYRKGLWNIFGLQLGIMALVAIVALGLGAALAASALAFNVIKWFGVAYLVWLGVAQLRARPQAVAVDEVALRGPRELLLQGFLVNISNPKGMIFMLAVLPQFIDPAAPQAIQYVEAGATLCFTDLVVMSGYTLLAARVLSALRDPGHIRWLNRAFGGLFVGAGALLAGFHRAA